MQKHIEIFADNGLLNIFDGDLVTQIDKQTSRLNHKKVVGFRLENDENNNVRISCRTCEDSRGVYAATVFLDGVRRRGQNGRSNFFPKDWTREQVAGVIFEAYQNKTLANILEHRFVGQAADGMKISLWLDKSGKVIDAMPLIEGVALKRRRRKGGGCCGQCGQPKHYVCLYHHPFPKTRGLKKVFKNIRYHVRKFYFNWARRLKFVD